jgi:hypothetical protein
MSHPSCPDERLRLEGSRLRLHVVRGPYGGAPEALPAFAEWIDPSASRCDAGGHAQARALAENGRRFAGEVLRPQALEDYFVEILDFCSRLHCA